MSSKTTHTARHIFIKRLRERMAANGALKSDLAVLDKLILRQNAGIYSEAAWSAIKRMACSMGFADLAASAPD